MDHPIVSHDEWLAARRTNHTASQAIVDGLSRWAASIFT